MDKTLLVIDMLEGFIFQKFIECSSRGLDADGDRRRATACVGRAPPYPAV